MFDVVRTISWKRFDFVVGYFFLAGTGHRLLQLLKLLNYLLQHADFVSSSCSATRRKLSDLAEVTVGRWHQPSKTTSGAQDQGSAAVLVPSQRTAPTSCFLRVVHTKVQGQSPRRAKEARRACEPERGATLRYSDGARISHTLRQDRVQGEEGKRRTRRWRPVLSPERK